MSFINSLFGDTQSCVSVFIVANNLAALVASILDIPGDHLSWHALTHQPRAKRSISIPTLK